MLSTDTDSLIGDDHTDKDELVEKEDLDLAIALSLSEAESESIPVTINDSYSPSRARRSCQTSIANYARTNGTSVSSLGNTHCSVNAFDAAVNGKSPMDLGKNKNIGTVFHERRKNHCELIEEVLAALNAMQELYMKQFGSEAEVNRIKDSMVLMEIRRKKTQEFLQFKLKCDQALEQLHRLNIENGLLPRTVMMGQWQVVSSNCSVGGENSLKVSTARSPTSRQPPVSPCTATSISSLALSPDKHLLDRDEPLAGHLAAMTLTPQPKDDEIGELISFD